jgi:hypothetical protein
MKKEDTHDGKKAAERNKGLSDERTRKKVTRTKEAGQDG